MSTLTKTEREQIIAAAQHAARHHPWRASPIEIMDLDTDVDKRCSGQKVVLNSKGRAAKELWLSAFAVAADAIEPNTGGPGGEPCDRCGKSTEKGRWNVCLSCAAHEED